MLRVIIEIWPRGSYEHKRTLAVMDIANDGSGSEARGNYVYRVYKRGTADGFPSRMPISRSGRITNYPRKSYPVWVLLKRILADAFKQN